MRAPGGQVPHPPGRGGGTTSKLLTSISAAEIKLQSSRSSSSLTSKVKLPHPDKAAHLQGNAASPSRKTSLTTIGKLFIFKVLKAASQRRKLTSKVKLPHLQRWASANLF
jgi:hypothetical protein